MGYFNSDELKKIKMAIQHAEHDTSGEIRVCVEKNCKTTPVARAAFFFKQLKMQETKERNGVLIYLATENRKIAIIGDKAFHQKNGEEFWQEALSAMKERFTRGNIVDGVVRGIEMTGKRMKRFFPHTDSDVNQLPDDVYDTDEL